MKIDYACIIVKLRGLGTRGAQRFVSNYDDRFAKLRYMESRFSSENDEFQEFISAKYMIRSAIVSIFLCSPE